ncbi:hypothetical protein BELL_0177g00130 [Botrytis elliptica]|uniref:Uncharacterized protein n=1 Tax=Botrytis elliptica TaxID=278938 RepID=A0A4Z1JRG3_9HELO|nr:hypothetical protein EAE99_005249 [Botrytis elliptica]TGO76056.1 hypothetical protein BELL_0177g00130 [Botrytis elliptica]
MNENGNNQRDKSSSPPSPRPSINQQAVADNDVNPSVSTADSQQQGTGVMDGRSDSVSGSSAGGVPMERSMACRGYSYHEYLSSAARASQQCSCGFTPRGVSTGSMGMGGIPMERTQGCRGYAYHEHLSSAAGSLQQCSCGFIPRRVSTGSMGMGGVPMERTQGCRGYAYHRRYTDCPCGRRMFQAFDRSL